MNRNRFSSALGICVGLVLVSAGCGGAKPFPQAAAPPTTAANPAQPPRARLLAAVQRVTDAKTARVALTMKIAVAGQTVTVSGNGVIDIAGRRTQLSLQESGGDESNIEVRLVGGTVYENTDGEGWTSLSIADATQSQSPDPTSYLDYLQGVADDVRVAGSAVVRGAPTTRYTATVDLARALANARSSAQRTGLQTVVRILGDLKIPTSVWIDAAGRLRKLEMSLDLGTVAAKLGAPAGSDPKIDETFELYDFGVAANIVAPAGAKDARTAALDNAAQSDLRNALTAEKTYYTDQETYTTDATILRQIEPSLDWGGKLTVVVGGTTPDSVVCLSEQSKSGTTFALADVSVGGNAGAFYATAACPASVNESSFAAFHSHW